MLGLGLWLGFVLVLGLGLVSGSGPVVRIKVSPKLGFGLYNMVRFSYG